jgi:hypothetical protein
VAQPITRGDQLARKDFFFEKKKQKTFALFYQLPKNNGSFLVLLSCE